MIDQGGNRNDGNNDGHDNASDNWDDNTQDDQQVWPPADPGDSGIDHEAADSTRWEGEQAENDRLDLQEDDRLPWLESADEGYNEGGAGRIMGLLLMGLAALAVLLGALWWFSNRGEGGSASEGDGSLIAAQEGDYKVAPTDPGGKTFEGTGDASFAASDGQRRDGKLADGAATPAPATAATPPPARTAAGGSVAVAGAAAGGAARPATAAPATTAPAPATGGVAVQIGAFSTAAKAEQSWTALAGRYSALQGQRHRVVEGRADIGTVHRLQVITGDAASAQRLCASLKAQGANCQVAR